jgi:hypothetical protein
VEIEVTRRQGRRRKKLLEDLMDRRGYCHLKEEAVDRNMCGGIVLGRGDRSDKKTRKKT